MLIFIAIVILIALIIIVTNIAVVQQSRAYVIERFALSYSLNSATISSSVFDS